MSSTFFRAAISANQVIAQMGTRNNAAARVVGRISLFQEMLLPNDDLAKLEAENRRLNSKVKQLEQQIGADDSNERLASILNNISAQVTRYIRKFEAEFQDLPARLNLSQLTIVFDRPERPVPMSRTGGGENHLAYHLSALLALHLFAAQNNRLILASSCPKSWSPRRPDRWSLFHCLVSKSQGNREAGSR